MVHAYTGKLLLPEITAVSLDRLAITISHTNSGRLLLGGQVRNGFTIALEACDPGFQYQGRAERLREPLLFEPRWRTRPPVAAWD